VDKCTKCGAETILYVDGMPLCFVCEKCERGLEQRKQPGKETLNSAASASDKKQASI